MGATMGEITLVLSAVREVGGAIDLSSKVWEHEARGKGGKWVRGNPVLHPALEHQSGLALRPQHDPAVSAMADKPATMKHLAMVHQQSLAAAHEAGQKAAEQAVSKAMQLHQQAEEQAKTEEGKKSSKKLIAMAASLLGGAAISYAEQKLGVPDVAVALSGISPALAEAAFEWKNRL
jgi:hypothetical protein